jgi:hypothetical protein
VLFWTFSTSPFLCLVVFVLLSSSMLFTVSSLMLLVLFLEEYINWALTSEKLIKYLEGQILMVDKIIMVLMYVLI